MSKNPHQQQDSANSKPTQNGESKHVAAQQKLVGALDALKDVMVSKEITEDLSTRVDAIGPKLKTLEERQQKELADAQELLDLTVSEIKDELRDAAEHSKSKSDALKRDLSELLQASEARLQPQIDQLNQGLTALQNGLREQTRASQQMSVLLQNMGALFSGAPQVTAPEDDNLEDALDEMFQEVDACAQRPEPAQD